MLSSGTPFIGPSENAEEYPASFLLTGAGETGAYRKGIESRRKSGNPGWVSAFVSMFFPGTFSCLAFIPSGTESYP
jgi:hypothetical protein